ncbi:MAG TPA: hypothetical protein VNK23_14695 [Candidatus Dormibacteraeota bacterium]|nr:hypothetical protein [Candidatus Dormibacteraeota bacterium]
MSGSHSWQRTVVVHIAGSIGEAMVIRSLLESEGIRSPVSGSNNIFAESEPAGGRGVEVYAFESQAEEARVLIGEYLQAAQSSAGDDDGE